MGAALFVAAAAPPAQAQDLARPAPRPEPSPSPAPTPQLTKAPVLKKQVPPRYPEEALRDKVSGAVTLAIDIDADGHVTGVQVTGSAGHGFDEAATEAASQFEFEPAEIDGKPGAIRIEYVQHFTVSTQPAPEPAPPEETPAPPVPPAALPPARVVARGRAREKGTRNPLVAADVTVLRAAPPAAPGEISPPGAAEAARVVATTDEQGRFEIRGEPGGLVRLIVSDTEHEPCIRDVTLPGETGPPVDLSCYMPLRRGGAYETTVRAPPQGEEVTRHTLSKGEMTSVPGTFGDPLRAIQNLPGMARMPYGLGLLIVRGANPQDTGVYVDGVRVPLLYHFLGGPSVLSANLIDKIDFYPGGFGARYGRNMAGVVDVTTRTEPLQGVHGAADVNLIDSSFYVEGPLTDKGTTGGVAGRRSYIDLILPAVIPKNDNGTTTVVAPVYYDYQARATQELGKNGSHGRLSLFAFGADDDLKVITSDPGRGNLDLGTHIGFHRVVAAWTTTAGAWTSRLSPSYGYDFFHFAAGDIGGGAHSHVGNLREELTRPLGRRLKIVTGFDGEYRYDVLDFTVPLPPDGRTYGRTAPVLTNIARGQSDVGAGLYLEALWDVTDRVRVVPGVRGDWFHFTETDRLSLDPRIVARWRASDRLAWKGGVGIFHQSAQPQQLDAQFGNPKLPLMYADQYHLGGEQRLTDLITLDATAYFLRRHNLPVASLERYSPDGKGRSYGLEILIKHEITRHFFGWIAYTLSRSEETVPGLGTVGQNGGNDLTFDPGAGTGAGGTVAAAPIPQARTAPGPAGAWAPSALAATTATTGDVYHPTAFDQTHNLIVVASYKVGAWELGTRFRLVTGTPQTPVTGASYDSDFDAWTPHNGVTNSERRATFNQLDVRVERTWVKDTWSLGAYLDVQNVYNATNPEGTLYDYRYRDSAYIRGLPIVPTLGVRGRF